MALQIGQEVRVKKTKQVFGKIVSFNGDLYLVEIDPRKLLLRDSEVEALEEPQSGSDELALIEGERWLALATARPLLEAWGGNIETDPIPEEIRNLLRKGFGLK